MDAKYLTIELHNPENQRYYVLRLGRDLFGWCLTKAWGRKGTHLGRVMHEPCESFEAGEQIVNAIMKIRYSHGYKLVNNS